MELRKVEVLVAPQFDDVMILVRDLVKVVKEKGDIADLTGKLISAIQGVDMVDDEAREVPFKVAASALHRGLEIAEALLAAPVKDGEPVEILGEPV